MADYVGDATGGCCFACVGIFQQYFNTTHWGQGWTCCDKICRCECCWDAGEFDPNDRPGASQQQETGPKSEANIDNTNRNIATRAPYIALAKELKVNIRCIFFDISQELCVHNSLYRVRAGLVSPIALPDTDCEEAACYQLTIICAFSQQPPEEERRVLPELAFLSYFKNLEIPTKEEGFDAEVLTVKWSFRGDSEAKRRWLMYWQ